jgi:hypothetical protein
MNAQRVARPALDVIEHELFSTYDGYPCSQWNQMHDGW